MTRVKRDAARTAAAQAVQLLKKKAKAAKSRTRELKEQWKAARKLSRQASREARDAEQALAATPTGAKQRAPRKTAVLRPLAAAARPAAAVPADVSEGPDRTDELLSPEDDA